MNLSRSVCPLAVVVTLLAPSLWATPPEDETPSAQKEAAPPKRGSRPGDVQKVFVIKNVDVNDMARLLSVFPAEISGADRGKLRALAVSAPPAVVAAIEETIKRLDVPGSEGKSADVTGYVLECSMKDAGNSPAALQDVVTQLKRTFNYMGCRVSQTLLARTSEHNAFSSISRDSSLAETAKPLFTTYFLRANSLDIDASEAPPVIRFRGLSFQGSGPGHSGEGFNGTVAVRDGQRVVLGKLSSGDAGTDQILVLTAKVVD